VINLTAAGDGRSSGYILNYVHGSPDQGVFISRRLQSIHQLSAASRCILPGDLLTTPTPPLSRPGDDFYPGAVVSHLRPSDVLSCWPDGLELTPGFYPGSNEQRRLF